MARGSAKMRTSPTELSALEEMTKAGYLTPQKPEGGGLSAGLYCVQNKEGGTLPLVRNVCAG